VNQGKILKVVERRKKFFVEFSSHQVGLRFGLALDVDEQSAASYVVSTILNQQSGFIISVGGKIA
jgi:hypothetical protein